MCNAWRQEVMSAYKSEDKALAQAMTYANDVRTWLLGHPGEVIFRTTLVQGGAYIDIACVRTP